MKKKASRRKKEDVTKATGIVNDEFLSRKAEENEGRSWKKEDHAIGRCEEKELTREEEKNIEREKKKWVKNRDVKRDEHAGEAMERKITK